MTNPNMQIEIKDNRLPAVSDPAMIAAAETSKQRIQAAFIMAMQNRRDPEQVRVDALKLCSIPKFAEQFISYKPIGKSKVAVDSIRAMEGLTSVYGNIQVDTQVTFDDEMTHREKCFVTDLETNMTYSDEFTLKKTVERKSRQDREVIGERKNSFGETVYIVAATEDEMLVKINAAKSKVIRNLLHRVIQPWLIEECREKAMETMRKQVKTDPDGEKRKIVDGFAAIGVSPSDLAKYLGHPIANLTQAELVDLRSVYTSVKNGEASFWEFLKAKTEDEDEKKKKDEKKDQLLKDAAVADLDRLREYVEKNGVPVSAEEIKSYVEGKGEIFAFDMVKPNVNRIAEAILAGGGK